MPQAEAVLDDGAGNPDNPDPARTVRICPQTGEDMMIGYFEVIRNRAGG